MAAEYRHECCETGFFTRVVVVTLLVLFAGLMSGLTLGLMSMSLVDLEVLANSGTPSDRKHASKILPVVRRQHLLLCTLLFCNAAAMEALPIFLDSLVPAWGAIVISVTLILSFGEIIPQAVCARYGLAIGAKVAPFVQILVRICFPIAFPVSKILTSIKGNGLEDFINGNQVCPEKSFSATSSAAGFSTGTENQEINPAYTMWIKTDQLILSWMLSSIQPNLLTTVIHCSTAKELLDTLTSMFVSQSQARIMPLKMQIQTLKKGSMSITDYFAKMKRISDSLALAGKPVEVNDFVQHVLTGLDSSDYETLVTTVLARGDNINLDEFYSLLLSHENRVEQKRGKIASDVTHNLSANVAQKQFNPGKNTNGNQKFNTGSYGGGYNSGAGSSDGNFSQIVCQICFIPGHGAHKCRNRFNSAFVPSRNQGRGVFNGNFRPGQRQYGRGFGYANGNRSSMAYGNFGNFGRNLNPQYGTGIGNSQFDNFNIPRAPGYQGHLMYSDPAAFNVYQPSNSHGGYSPAHAFVPTGDYSGSPSVPVPAHAPEMIEDPAWYIDSGATNHITNDPGQELRDHFA